MDRETPMDQRLYSGSKGHQKGGGAHTNVGVNILKAHYMQV